MMRQIDSVTVPRSHPNLLLIGLGAALAIGIAVTGAFLLMRPALAEPRPVVLSVYCASSAAWMTTLAPLLDAQTQTGPEGERGRVTAARIRSAYERRCTTPD